ncbi:MAG: hypothetical protein EZS28_001806 [Streblomastix strix]|uniref:Integrase SAM-like N-terminal domain-containing protein n=1 Tax=Streblomastix strix TaxID=222440 RepID=A0A5J4X612_9EUKA|nr:MAG: hypothetical protein EZS28_001806 [Streblomastix strix]
MPRDSQQMIIEGQKFNTQKKYMQTMGLFDDWMGEKKYFMDDILRKRIPFIHTEFMTWLTKTKKTIQSSAKHHASILNTLLSLIFGTEQVSATAKRLTTHAISNFRISNQRYGSTQDISQLYDRWRNRPESQLLSNEELQTKLASLMMSLCFVRMEKMTIIDLSVSIIDGVHRSASVCIPPKQSRQRQRYDLRRTEEATACPTESFFVWLARLREHFHT